MSAPAFDAGPSYETLQAARACDDATLRRAIVAAQRDVIQEAAATFGALVHKLPYLPLVAELHNRHGFAVPDEYATHCAKLRVALAHLTRAVDDVEAAYETATRVISMLTPADEPEGAS